MSFSFFTMSNGIVHHRIFYFVLACINIFRSMKLKVSWVNFQSLLLFYDSILRIQSDEFPILSLATQAPNIWPHW